MLKPGRPRHEQISDWLREQIEHGAYTAHDQLPTERQLGEQFQVSRITVRRALQTLEAGGLIYRRQGLGSFVADRRLRQGLVRLTDFVEDMQQAGLEASSEVIQFTPEPATGRIAEALGVEPGKTVCRLERLRRADGEPIAFDRTWLPVFYGQLLSEQDLQHETIYHILEHRYEIPIVRGRYRLDAVNADAVLARSLAIPRGRALLLIERISLTTADKPVYFQQRFYRSDRVAYELELERSEGETAPSSQGMPLREFAPVFRSGLPGAER